MNISQKLKSSEDYMCRKSCSEPCFRSHRDFKSLKSVRYILLYNYFKQYKQTNLYIPYNNFILAIL